MANKEISKETQEKLVQMQNIQRQVQMIVSQKQQFEMSKIGSEQALKELDKADGQIFRAVGPILIETKKDAMKTELGDSVKKIEERVEVLKKQEERLVGKGKELEAELSKEFEQK